MKAKSYTSLVRKLKNTNSLLRVQMALTYRCNLKCIHCFETKNAKNELTISEIKDILEQLKSIGCLMLTFTGGELFLRKDILEIFDFARKKGFAIGILTNGTLLTKELIKKIKKFNPIKIQVSLYGATREVHDSITQVPGSFIKILNTLNLLKADNLKFRLAFIVMRQNAHELKKARDMAKKRKWDLLTDYVIYPRYDGAREPLKCRITQKQLKVAVDEIKPEGDYLERIPKKEHLSRNRRGFFLLPIGRNECYISAQGEVFPYCTVRTSLGKLRQSSFRQIWQHSRIIQNLRKIKLEDLGCSSCDKLVYCCGDLGMAFVECGDLRVIPLEICRFVNSGIRRDGRLIPGD